MRVSPGQGASVQFLPGFTIALVFVALAGMVFLLALIIVVKTLKRRAGLPVRTGILDRPWLRRGVLGTAALGILCVLYGRFVESRWVEVTHVRIPTSKMAPGSPPIRILHVTDTHCDRWGPNEARLLGIVREEKPDLIAFTGDATNDAKDGLAAFRRLASFLQAPFGCFAVKGNWEAWFWSDLDVFGGTALQELTVAAPVKEVLIRGTRLAVCGVPYDAPHGAQALSRVPPEAFCLFLCHTPDMIREPGLQAADLYLAGHTHGGQVRLPLHGAMVTLSKYGKAYESGLFREGRCRMYVCRGLGMEGGIIPRVRFWCRPEVAVLELVPEGR